MRVANSTTVREGGPALDPDLKTLENPKNPENPEPTVAQTPFACQVGECTKAYTPRSGPYPNMRTKHPEHLKGGKGICYNRHLCVA